MIVVLTEIKSATCEWAEQELFVFELPLSSMDVIAKHKFNWKSEHSFEIESFYFWKTITKINISKQIECRNERVYSKQLNHSDIVLPFLIAYPSEMPLT